MNIKQAKGWSKESHYYLEDKRTLQLFQVIEVGYVKVELECLINLPD